MQGLGVLVDYKKDIIYFGYFNNDLPEGLQIVTNLIEKTEYRGIIKNLKKHGIGIYRCINRGLTFKGDWKDD